ncbi:MAG: N-acetyltransferase family protein [Gaiellaceae bacterium]
MSVLLRPLREDEYDSFYADAVETYALDLEENGGFTREHARTKSVADHERTLTQGLATPDTSLRVVEDADGRRVGIVWWAIQTSQVGVRRAYLYAIEIDEAHRGRGLGRAAMLALEDEVRSHGLDRIELNVFGGNQVARGLYRSLGYAESAVYMVKSLPRA